MMKTIALIPAAGKGRRMGFRISKPYLPLAGRPIIYHTLKIFEDSPQIVRVILIVQAEEVEYCKREVVGKYNIKKVDQVVAGGDERQDSVSRGLEAIPSGFELVVIHDGVRPLLTADLLEQVISEAERHDCALLALPAVDTLKRAEGGWVTGSIDRHSVWLAQTPQVFRYSLIREAYRQASRDGFRGTDDASLIERLGRDIYIVEGDPLNFKITTPQDLALAEALLQDKK